MFPAALFVARRGVSLAHVFATGCRAELDPPEEPLDPDADEIDLNPWSADAWELSALEDEDEPEPEHGDFWREQDDLDD